MRILCKLGFHKWEQDRELVIRDIHPGLDGNWQTPKRQCIHCGRKEYWLPGFGGSEFGCWSIEKENS